MAYTGKISGMKEEGCHTFVISIWNILWNMSSVSTLESYLAPEFKFDVRSEHWGCLEVAIPSEAAKIAIKGNIHFMHIYISVIYASDFKFEA